jgi:hypothetical protein
LPSSDRTPEPDWEAVVLERAAADQLARARLTDSAEPTRDAAAVRALDLRHRDTVREVLDAVGWPTVPPWRRRSVTAFWLLVQHCPDNAAQRQALTLLRQACAAGLGDGEHLAYLEDRVRIRQGLPQRYGTQLSVADGTVELLPVDDRAAVERRRRELGLGPLDDYVRGMSEHLRGVAAWTIRKDGGGGVDRL